MSLSLLSRVSLTNSFALRITSHHQIALLFELGLGAEHLLHLLGAENIVSMHFRVASNVANLTCIPEPGQHCFPILILPGLL